MTDTKAPEFNGECAFAVSLGKTGVVGSPGVTLESNGRTYQFKNGIARFLFKAIPGRADKAAEAWTSGRR